MTKAPRPSIAGWADEDLRQTANNNFGLGTEAGLPEPIRFLVGVARTIRNRHQEADLGSEDTPAVFFLEPKGPAGLDLADLKSQPMLDNGRAQLGGSFWFVGPQVYGALGLAVSDWSDDGNIFGMAIEMELGSIPAVFFDPRGKKPKLRHYPSGLANADDVTVSSFVGEKMDLERVIEIVDEATRTHLDAPTGGAELWKDSRRHRPSEKAERNIQFALKVALHHALPTAVIREEQPHMVGRLDLEIEEPLMEEGKSVRHAILELKVLRSCGSTGTAVSATETRKAVKEGLQQAIAYRNARRAKAAALCCFDMRVKSARKKCFHGVRATAKREKLELGVWPIYSSAAERRDATV
jgi:hypothetical protein